MRRPEHQILCGEALEMLAALADETVQTCVTSPPYKDLRDYGVVEQIGLGETVPEYLEKLWTVFDEVWRVLRPDGTLWVNIGDSYAGSGKGPTGHNGIGNQAERQGFTGGRGNSSMYVKRGDPPGHANGQLRAGSMDVPAKSLAMIPERFAWGMIERGWILRSRIAWCKKSAMPESVKDRPTSAWEHIWLFSKSARYYYDAEAVRSDLSANLRNYWLLGPEPQKTKHYAAYPREIPRRAILAGTSAAGQCSECGKPWERVTEISYTPHGVSAKSQVKTTYGERGSGDLQSGGIRPQELPFGRATKNVKTTGWVPQCYCAAEMVPQIVLDPFTGTGTTSVVADELGRDSIGIDVVPQYIDIVRKRLRGITRIEGVKIERRTR